MCNCIKEINEKLDKKEGRNSHIKTVITTKGTYPELWYVAYPENKAKEDKILIPLFCPFCGVEYE